MITWIQIKLQKHMRKLFAVLLVIVVVSFVLAIGNQGNPFSGIGKGKRLTKAFFGYDLSDERQKGQIESLANLSVQLNPELVPQSVVRRTPAGPRVDIESYARFRVAGLALADQLGLPEPGRDELKAFVSSRTVFAGEDGQFSPANYNMALQVLQASGTPESTVVGVLKQDYRLQQLREIAGGPGFVLPYEVQVRGEVQRTQWTVEMASSNLESFNPAIEPREEDLRQAFEQNPARFEVPAKIELGAVLFPGTAFLSEVAAPEEGELRAYFERNKARYGQPAPQPAEGEEPQPAPEPVFEEVREAVAADLALEKANRIAQERADAYTMELWRSEAQKLTPQALEIARGMGASVEDIAPYAENSPPRDTPVPPQALANAWSLTSSERFFSDVIPTRGGAAVLLYKGTIPARQPAFEEVRDDVAADWLAQRKRDLFVQQGELWREAILKGMQEGRSFKEAAEAQGLQVQSFADFNAASMPFQLRFWPGEFSMADSPMLLARKMNPGDVSQMRLSGQQGTLLHVAARSIPEPAADENPQEILASLQKSYSDASGAMLIEGIAQRRLQELEAELKAAYEQ